MSKKKLSYPNDRPHTLQDITKSYIAEYFAYRVEQKEIGEAEMREWIKVREAAIAAHTNSPIKAFQAYRKEFARLYYPHLLRQTEREDTEFYNDLLKRLQGSDEQAQ